jgi:hypothetical protein
MLNLPAFAQIASSLLNPLVASWIRSEVDQVENLKVQISGSDADIFNGVIAQAVISGDNLAYQGFQVSQVQLNGQNIRLNVAEAVNGKNLRLLAPVPVAVQMRLSEADLNQTLQSPMIQQQLAQAKVKLPIPGGENVPFLIQNPKVKLENGRIRIQANVSTGTTAVPVTLTTGLNTQNQNQLVLINPTWVTNGQTIPIAGLNNLVIQLDPDVQVNRLDLQTGQVLYDGQLTIQPEEVALPG